MSRLRCIALVGFASLAACARSLPPPRAPAPPVEEPPPPIARLAAEDGMSVQGTLGTISDVEILAAFRTRWSEVARCSQAAQAGQTYLTGTVQLKLRIGQDGVPLRAYIERSTLGSYGTERCILEIARALVFASPRGGAEAEFSFPIEIKPRPSSPYVVQWEEGRVAPSIERSKEDLGLCRGEPLPLARSRRRASHGSGKGSASKVVPLKPVQLKPVPPSLVLTLYIAPGGRVASAGLQADGPLDDEFATCFVERARTWKLDDPRGQFAKASFEVVR